MTLYPETFDPTTQTPFLNRLSRESLLSLPRSVQRPGFNPAALRTGILHLGCGSFHRGHQAPATQAAIEAEGKAGLRWGIASVSMRQSSIADALNEQQCLYTMLERGERGSKARVIGSIREAIFAQNEDVAVFHRMADPAIEIVTLTVTAAGYHLEPATGHLDLTHPDVAHDLRHAASPITAVGTLVRGLAECRSKGTRPPVIMSCDNLENNGSTLRQAVLDFASASDDALSKWIEGNVQFPNSMVDRIVPATTDEDLEEAVRLLGGVHDAVPVPAEPWMRWVIEDFEGDRPLWGAGGAEFVQDVRPYEISKLRMLNGAHMFLAYVGMLHDKMTIAEAAADPLLGELAERFILEEQGATVPLSESARQKYTANLMQRFRNPGIVHGMDRIGRNGSTKMSTRVLEPMRQNLEEGRDVQGAVLLIASWIRWFALHDQDALGFDVVDPRAETLHRLYQEKRHSYIAQAEAFLSMEEVFGQPLPQHDQVVKDVADVLHQLSRKPVKQVLADSLS